MYRIFNYVELIVDIVEVKIFFKKHKKTLIDVIGGQK